MLMLTFPSAALACTFIAPTGAEKWTHIRASEPLKMDASCAFVNGGISDEISGGPAVPLGDGRFYQLVENGLFNRTIPTAIIVDCNFRQMTMIGAKYINLDDEEPHDPCFGPVSGELSHFLPPDGPLELTEGRDLLEFEEIAFKTEDIQVVANGGRVMGPDIYGIPYPRKDRVDFLCGCKIHYPESAGAKK